MKEIEGEIFELWDSGDFQTIKSLADHIIGIYGNFGKKDDSVRVYIHRMITKRDSDKEVVLENVKLKKSNQKLSDIQRIERKSFREQARVENAVAALGEELVKLNKKHGIRLAKSINIRPLIKDDTRSGTGVIHITDVHANELIDLPHNQYNFTVLSKRLKKQINESLAYFRFKDISEVLIAFTSDLLNSDRRLDELLNASTNRSKAALLTSHIITQAILEVRNAGYKVDIISVLGNESRSKHEMTFSNEGLSDNYDLTIMGTCRQVIDAMNIEGIKFHSIDKVELVVKVDSQNWLFAHDIQKATDKQASTQSAIGRYALQGIKVDFVVGGHVHSTRVTDISARSSSLAGSNSYNEIALGLLGRAAGLVYVVKNGIRGIEYLDLQDASNEGYEIISQLEAYNVKSEMKTKSDIITFQVII